VSAGVTGIIAQQNVPLSVLSPRLANGINLYGEGRWGEAIVELRRSQGETADSSLRAEAQFWIAMSEFSAGDYQSALHDMDEFVRIDPRSRRVAEIPYHKARTLFYLGRYNEALPLLKQYSDSIRIDGRYVNGVRMDDWASYSTPIDNQDDYNRKASALYWIGECFYALDQYDEAEAAFNSVIMQFTRSHKYETSVNRIALIKEKRIQSGLLDIVKWNQESARQGASAQTQTQRDNAYENYQQQLGTILGSGYITDPANAPEATAGSGRLLVAPGVARGGNYDPETLARLLSIKTIALEMMDRLVSLSNNYEIIDGGTGIMVMPEVGRIP
jgi:tetratricopeptide (TPR) repeat protein